MVSTMDRLVILGRFFFALAFIGLRIHHFLLGEFIIGCAPAWLESIPGRPAWAYLTGIAFIVKSVVLISGKGARAAAIVATLPIFMWALVRRIPIVAADSFLAPTWTQVRKAIILLVRFVISDSTPDSCRFEQAFSDDGGKNWEVNWIAIDTRVKDETNKAH